MSFDQTLQPTIAQARKISGDRAARPVVASADDGDIVLVLADEPLRDMLGEAVRAHGYEVQSSATPLETVQLLERLKDRLRCAIISSQLPWAPAVWELLIDEYPDIEPVVVEA